MNTQTHADTQTPRTNRNEPEQTKQHYHKEKADKRSPTLVATSKIKGGKREKEIDTGRTMATLYNSGVKRPRKYRMQKGEGGERWGGGARERQRPCRSHKNKEKEESSQSPGEKKTVFSLYISLSCCVSFAQQSPALACEGFLYMFYC